MHTVYVTTIMNDTGQLLNAIARVRSVFTFLQETLCKSNPPAPVIFENDSRQGEGIQETLPGQGGKSQGWLVCPFVTSSNQTKAH